MSGHIYNIIHEYETNKKRLPCWHLGQHIEKPYFVAVWSSSAAMFVLTHNATDPLHHHTATFPTMPSTKEIPYIKSMHQTFKVPFYIYITLFITF